ncbi:MAG: transglutaminase domain-containing protein [Kiritimatiellae bacterium]|nr:transglutaminase domain-containing protein [Kiritimatiellia bacterium]
MPLPRQPITYTAAARRRGRGHGWRLTFMLLAVIALAALLWREQTRRLQAPRERAASSPGIAPAASPAARVPVWREFAPKGALAHAATANDTTMTTTAPPDAASMRLGAILRAPAAGVGTSAAVTSSVPVRGRDGTAPAEPPLFAALRASRGQPVPAVVADLARQIVANCANDAERARALYDWITANIKYDILEWEHITGGGDAYEHAHDPLSVLERGTTVCAGYAWLYDALARSVGLKSTFLIGDVRGYRGTPDDDLVSAFKHAWNAVEIDGRWRLLDATWGARQTGEEAGAYLERSAYYFDTPPRQFVFDHLPESSSWQLLQDPVPDEPAFRALPNLKPSFFRDGLLLGNALSSTLPANAGESSRVIIAAPESVSVAATLTPLGAGGGPAEVLPVMESGIRRDFQIGPLPAGDYILRIYSTSGPRDGFYDCSADFVIRVGSR